MPSQTIREHLARAVFREAYDLRPEGERAARAMWPMVSQDVRDAYLSQADRLLAEIEALGRAE